VLTSWKVIGSIPDGVVSLEFFTDINISVALWPWRWTQPLKEMSTKNISWRVKAASA
jgi:hypothetical protein